MYVILQIFLLSTGVHALKVIIHKSRSEVSLVVQDTIENVSVAYSKFIIRFPRKMLNFHLHFIQFLSDDATISKKRDLHFFAHENMKKTPSKVAHNWPKIYFFSIANHPKTGPNLNFCSIKIAHRATNV